jgi:GxxExxY protein
MEKEKFLPLSNEEERIGKIIVDCAFKVHSQLGPGLLERIYEICFVHVLRKQGLKVDQQLPVQINYDGIIFDEGFRIDTLVNDKVICELKAVKGMDPLWEAQLLTYLKLGKLRLGYLINFNVPLIKDGIKRRILN